MTPCNVTCTCTLRKLGLRRKLLSAGGRGVLVCILSIFLATVVRGDLVSATSLSARASSSSRNLPYNGVSTGFAKGAFLPSDGDGWEVDATVEPTALVQTDSRMQSPHRPQRQAESERFLQGQQANQPRGLSEEASIEQDPLVLPRPPPLDYLSEWHGITIVAISAVFWATCLALIWLCPWFDADFKKQGGDRLLSLIHAALTANFGLYVELTTAPTCTVGSDWTRIPVLIHLGFVTVDLGSMLICDVWRGWRQIDFQMLMHHFIMIISFTVASTLDIGVWLGSTLLVNEFSTIFLNVFWYLGYIKKKDTWMFMVNGLFLVLVFLFARIVFIPLSAHQFYSLHFCLDVGRPVYNRGGFILVSLAYVVMYTLNCCWFLKLALGAIKCARGGFSGKFNKNTYEPTPQNQDDLQKLPSEENQYACDKLSDH